MGKKYIYVWLGGKAGNPNMKRIIFSFPDIPFLTDVFLYNIQNLFSDQLSPSHIIAY